MCFKREIDRRSYMFLAILYLEQIAYMSFLFNKDKNRRQFHAQKSTNFATFLERLRHQML